MKTKLITLIALAALIIVGCSRDDIENDEFDNSIELRNLPNIQPNATDFTYKEVGEFEYQTNNRCATKGEIYSIGFINSEDHGKVLYRILPVHRFWRL